MRQLGPMLAVLIVIAGCTGAAAPPSASSGGVAGAGRPEVVIESPPGNAQVAVNQVVEVVTAGVDAIGVARIDLLVNGIAISSAEAPSPQRLFRAVHTWTPPAAGMVELGAVAYRSDGAPSDPMTITVEVLPAGSSVVPYPTYGGPLPTYRGDPVPSGYRAPTYAPGPTPSPTVASATSGTAPTATYHASPTATATAAAPPTTAATYQASPTATATSAPIAPPDTDHHWSIPYNGSAQLSGDVSYPAGDVEDKVYWTVTGLSNFPPGDHGTLNVFATCEGSGTQAVTFQLGANGAKFGCGTQVITRQLVTSEANTGLIRVYAVGAAYVHWTLSANVAP